MADETKKIFLENKIKPLRQLGQNFLSNKTVIDKIVSCAGLSQNDFVLEIGTGTGNLTKAIAKKSGFLLSLEKDKTLAYLAQKNFKKQKNIRVIHADALKINLNQEISAKERKLKNKSFKIITNLPYSITGAFFRKFLNFETGLKAIIVMVQKEVAQRILAKSPPFNILAITAQFYGQAELVSHVPKELFWPKPKFDSSIIKIQITPDQQRKKIEKYFFEILRAGFAKKRKTLANSLIFSSAMPKNKIPELLLAAKIKKQARAEEISLFEWITLAVLAQKNAI